MDKKKLIIIVSTICLVVLAVALACLLGISPDVILPYVLDTGVKDLLEDEQFDKPAHEENETMIEHSLSGKVVYI